MSIDALEFRTTDTHFAASADDAADTPFLGAIPTEISESSLVSRTMSVINTDQKMNFRQMSALSVSSDFEHGVPFYVIQQKSAHLTPEALVSSAGLLTRYGPAEVLTGFDAYSSQILVDVKFEELNVGGELSLFTDLVNKDFYIHDDAEICKFHVFSAIKASETSAVLYLTPQTRQNSEEVAVDDLRREIDARYSVYICTHAGTTADSKPDFVDTGESFSDGTVTWKLFSYAFPVRSHFLSGAKVFCCPNTKEAQLNASVDSVTVNSEQGSFDLASFAPSSGFFPSGKLTLYFTSSVNYVAALLDDSTALEFDGNINYLLRPISNVSYQPYFSLLKTAFSGTFVEGDTVEILFTAPQYSIGVCMFSKLVPGDAAPATCTLEIFGGS